MDHTWASRGVAVVATPFNPPVLRHAYLHSRGIVDDSWDDEEWREGSRQDSSRIVQYGNGCRFSLSEDMLEVEYREPGAATDSAVVPDIATRFVETQEPTLLEYKGVGVNLTLFLPMEDPQAWMLDTFIGSGRARTHAPVEAAIQLVYPVDKGTRLHVTFRAGSQRDATDTDPVSGVLFHANYDISLEPAGEATAVLAGVARFENLCHHFDAFWPGIVGNIDE